MIKKGWLPARSPYSLIQEDVWPDEWGILVVCMLLNCTQRKQVEKVWPEFRRRWPTPEAFAEATEVDVVDVIRPLGFVNRRTSNLRKMTTAYLAREWKHARELPGIGDYAAASWEIFCMGRLPERCPKDHALTQYWLWATKKGRP